jgi:hypothetical protein
MLTRCPAPTPTLTHPHPYPHTHHHTNIIKPPPPFQTRILPTPPPAPVHAHQQAPSSPHTQHTSLHPWGGGAPQGRGAPNPVGKEGHGSPTRYGGVAAGVPALEAADDVCVPLGAHLYQDSVRAWAAASSPAHVPLLLYHEHAPGGSLFRVSALLARCFPTPPAPRTHPPHPPTHPSTPHA